MNGQISNTTGVRRRRFLITSAVVAGGLSMRLSVPSSAQTTADNEAAFSAWLQILPDDTVVVTVPSPEIGNGASTQHAMNIAEELECDWERVRVEFADYRLEHASPGSFAVGLQPFFSGHSTDHARMPHAMQLGASARERLKAAAAMRWSVPVSEVSARDSVLTHVPSGQTLRFGEVAVAAAQVTLDAEPSLKSPDDWRLLGRRCPAKLQIPDIVAGAATFGIDVQVPGMVYAAVRLSPVHGGLLKSHQADAVMSMPGVRAVVVIDPDLTPGAPVTASPTFGFDGSELRSGVAVIADHYWQAKKALEALPIEWDVGLGAFWSSNALLQERQDQLLDRWEGSALTRKGSDELGTGRLVEATYRTPFCEHATMEPLNGTACYTDERLDLWHPAQDIQQCFWVAVDESGLHPDNVYFHQTLVGGGFGRRTSSDDARLVVAVARQYPGVPVKVIWSREETTAQGAYRTAVATRFKAALADDSGLPSALQAQACFSGMALNLGYTDMPYAGAIPNLRLKVSELPTHVHTGAYRAPCFNSHAFMVETFIDECAVAAGIDPLEYRLRLLKDWDPAWSDCLRLAADKIGWSEPVANGVGRGIAISNWPGSGQPQSGTTVCTAVQVAVSAAGELTIQKIETAFDCGRVANRDAVEAQIQGGVVFGLNMTLLEGLTLRDGEIVERNFDTLPMLRMRDMPPINVHFDALSGHERFAIIGEAPVGSVGPALGNAIFSATGKRLRQTPFRDADLRTSEATPI